MPDDLRPRDIGEMPAQHALSPGSAAEARGRFFNTGNAFNIVNPPVPDHAFVDEPRRALDAATPTGLIACDLSDELGCPFPAWQPLVRRHPVTGRQSLYISPIYNDAVEGLEEAAASRLIDDLTEFAAQPRFMYKHRWEPDDVLM
jgi:hypothetical protein